MVNSAGLGPFGETFEIVSPDTAFDNYKAIGPQLGPRNLFTGYLGWMNNSPDYNHSAGTNKTDDDFVEIPGGAVNAYIKWADRSEEHTSELQSRPHLVCRLLLEKKKK